MLLLLNLQADAQDTLRVGINTTSPSQTLDVNGKIRIDDDTNLPEAGAIRWNIVTQDFEGYNGMEWVSLTKFGTGIKWGNETVMQYWDGESSQAYPGDLFGYSIALDGEYAVVGAVDANRAFVFKRSGSILTEQDILLPLNGFGGGYGYSVDISGDYAIVGSPFSAEDGKADIHKRSGSVWISEATLVHSDPFGDFGRAVAISMDYAIVGQPRYGNEEGRVYIYRRDSISWTQNAVLSPSDGGDFDEFGQSVSISGNYAIVGAHLHDTGGNEDQGKAYIFERNGTSWTEQAILFDSDGAAFDYFGFATALCGDYAVVGAPFGGKGGKAYAYVRSDSNWIQQDTLIPPDGEFGDGFGLSVDISGENIIVGAPFYDTGGNENQGKAYIFKRDGIQWMMNAILISSNGIINSNFGRDVSISGSHAIVGRQNHLLSLNGRLYLYGTSQ